MKEEHLEVKRGAGFGMIDRLLLHLDKVVAALAVAVVGAQVAGFLFQPAERFRHAQEDAQSAARMLNETLSGTVFPVDERMTAVKQRIGQLVTQLKGSESAGVDLTSGLTYPVGYLKTLRPGESNEIRFVAPTDTKAVPDAGVIVVTWSEPAGNNVAIGTYDILRAEDGGAEAVAASVEGTSHEWRDAGVKPGHAYRYRVIAVAKDADLARTSRGRSEPSPVAEARAIADFKVALVDEKADEVQIRVSKWIGGEWRDRVFSLKQGQAVGARDDALGVDFSTGRTISKIEAETVDVEETRAEVVFDAKGRVVVESGAAKRVPVTGKVPVRKIKVSLTGAGLPDDVLSLEKR